MQMETKSLFCVQRQCSVMIHKAVNTEHYNNSVTCTFIVESPFNVLWFNFFLPFNVQFQWSQVNLTVKLLPFTVSSISVFKSTAPQRNFKWGFHHSELEQNFMLHMQNIYIIITKKHIVKYWIFQLIVWWYCALVYKHFRELISCHYHSKAWVSATDTVPAFLAL
jgi:hypothetical protein